MNNNRNNNRRRGRGNRQQGGGNQNRVDSRARGNAPQLLDKYKKLAQDAAHNGDRVQAEYYLQFADHYFRVLADNKARQDEARGGGRRDNSDDDDGEEDDFDSPRQNDNRQNDGRQNDGRQNESRRGGRNDRQNDRQNDRGGDRNDRQRGRNRSDDQDDNRSQGDDFDDDGNDGRDDGEGNPFTRGNRGRNRQQPDQARDADGETRRPRGKRAASRSESVTNDAGEIDAAALPPSISGSDEPAEADEKPKRKLPPRRRRPAADEGGEDGESLKAVG